MTILWWIIGVTAAIFLLTVFRGAPYVPSRSRDIERAFGNLYAIGKGDLLVDIGSGDGKVLMAAARRGARAVGYEINPLLVLVSRRRLRHHSGATVRLADFWRSTLPDETTIVYTFGDGRDIERMAQYVEQQATRLGRSLYFISYAFSLKHRAPLRRDSVYFLYEIEPLQTNKP